MYAGVADDKDYITILTLAEKIHWPVNSIGVLGAFHIEGDNRMTLRRRIIPLGEMICKQPSSARNENIV